MNQISTLISQQSNKKRWYETEQNTADLIQKAVSALHVAGLSGDHLWHLIRLTWITKGPHHWKLLKLPALAALFGKKEFYGATVQEAVSSLQLPEPVAAAAIKPTGFVNFYMARRNSARDWCAANSAALRGVILDAHNLGSNVDTRIELAAEVGKLPPVLLPNGKKPQSAANLVTPLLACLDAFGYFPAVNGEAGVKKLLDSMEIDNVGIKAQVKALMNLVGTWGIADAHMIDVCADDIAEAIRNNQFALSHDTTPSDGGVPLPYYDDEERAATQSSTTVVYRQRHDTMTNALRTRFATFKPAQGTDPNCRYDVLLRNYDGAGRDLLIEVKPDPDKGSLRIAIGQLFDYRRFLSRRFATDLAVLTITPPAASYSELLSDLQITRLWFENDDCANLFGDGKAWPALKCLLTSEEAR